MKFIDTHIHLQDFSKECTDKVISEAAYVGIEKFLCVSSKPEDWQSVVGFQQRFPSVIYSAIGIHPWYASETKERDMVILENLLEKNKSLLIGEIGLDGYKEFMSLQENIFKRQLVLAKKYNRAIVIHCVKAQAWFEKNWSLLPQKFVFHSYNGKEDFAKKIVQKGGYISFSFSILKNKEREKIINSVPLDKMLLETDSPYQSFEKDVENQPVFLPNLAFEVAKIVGIEYEDFAQKIYQNAMEFLKIG